MCLVRSLAQKFLHAVGTTKEGGDKHTPCNIGDVLILKNIILEMAENRMSDPE